MKNLLSLILATIILLLLVSCDTSQNNNHSSGDINNAGNTQESDLDKIEKWYNDKMPAVNQNLINYASSVSGISNINVTSSKFRFGEDSGWYDCHYTIMFSCKVNGASCNGEARAFLKYNDTNVTWFHFEIYRVLDYATIVEHYDDSYDKIIEDYYKSLVDPTYTPQNNHNNSSSKQNSIEDLRYIVNGVCNDYNNGQTAYNGKLYATINSATSITILHDIPNSLSFSERLKVKEMENTIARLFSETLNAEFPENITIYVETSVAYTSKSSDSSGSSGNVNDINTLQSIVEEVCFIYNKGFTPYNGYISAVVNSATSITVEHVIMDEIAADEEYVVDDLAEMVIDYFEEAFEAEGFLQKIEITVESEYTLAETSQWISADELDSIYDLYVWWRGSEIWIMTRGYSSTTYILTGSPISTFLENQVYTCDCDDNIISVKYVDDILFWYDDLIQAGIILE